MIRQETDLLRDNDVITQKLDNSDPENIIQ